MKNKTSYPNEVRIIGGKWRGRKLRFPTTAELRPTPNRVRETLFNWLISDIIDARCLDLFAGSGALGLEALSRGAAHVTFVDQSPAITHYLKKQLETLAAENADVYCQTFQTLLKSLNSKERFNVVFLDPPFHQGLIKQSCAWLEQENLLAPNALIYIEAEAEFEPLTSTPQWKILHSKTAGQVGYHLLQRA